MPTDEGAHEPRGDVTTVARDDRIYPATRWVGAAIPPFLIVAFVMLYVFPDDTGRLFAWTISPRMIPLLMGAGYISGSYFFVRLVLGRTWHRFSRGFLPITAFTWFMGLATILHWDRFNHDHVSFYAWLALYTITPFLVPALWLYNRRADPHVLEPGDVAVPGVVRLVTGLIGAGVLLVAVLMFLFPEQAIDVWPWRLSPLTARVVAGWFALPGVLGLSFAVERRWSAWRITLESQLLGIALIGVGAARAWSDFDTSRAATWFFLAGMAGLFLFLLGVYVVMERRRGMETAT